MAGWIKIYRSSLDHWLYTEYRPLTRREAWETILFTVNFEPSKVLIKGQLYECDRGQSLLSLSSWAEKFVWSIKQVRTFFDLLQKDGMIVVEGLQYTTRLTVCNYATYQDYGHTKGTPRADGWQTEGTPRATIKEEEEGKEYKEEKEKRFNFKKSLIDLGVSEKVASDWLKVRSKKNASNTETAFEKIKSEILKSPLHANESIKIAAENSWQGFKAEWIKNQKQTSRGFGGSNGKLAI